MSEQDQSPYRLSGEPYREPRPDGLEEMRRAWDRKIGRTTRIVLVPFGFGVAVLCAFGLASSLIGLHDGIPLGLEQVFMLGVFALGLALALYGAWRWLPRSFTIVLLVGALAVAGIWARSDTVARRSAWADQAHRWCRVELGDAPPAAELATCVAQTIGCIANLAPRIGDSSMVVYLGNPCLVTDPRP